jgi:peroxiredoxin
MPAPIRIGDVVPDVELLDHTGRPWPLSSMRGGRVLLILHRHLG